LGAERHHVIAACCQKCTRWLEKTFLVAGRAFPGLTDDIKVRAPSPEVVMTSTRRRRRSTPETDDTELVRRACGGDATAFASLYRQHRKAITRYVSVRVSGEDVDEVVADVFVRAWRSLPKYRSKGHPFLAWLFGVARNAVADHHRRRHRRPTEPLDSQPHLASSRNEVERLMARLSVRDALGNLPKQQQRVIELKYFAGFNNDETAAALKMTPGAVNATQWRALQRLRELMEDQR
jgi:RNA polymerase sigma-70 factor (ECF subfamily)